MTRTNGSVTAELRTKGIRTQVIHPKYFSKDTLATQKQPDDTQTNKSVTAELRKAIEIAH
ncbi:hypothetical protein ACFQRK_19920 [Parapedobacter sp. GCM10030251]|uniref:hypothetical protein n=1 Tax=Parapedobacter sp. GCM10030251 TaxID=3273419 RepID=UPI0036121E63